MHMYVNLFKIENKLEEKNHHQRSNDIILSVLSLFGTNIVLLSTRSSHLFAHKNIHV